MAAILGSDICEWGFWVVLWTYVKIVVSSDTLEIIAIEKEFVKVKIETEKRMYL